MLDVSYTTQCSASPVAIHHEVNVIHLSNLTHTRAYTVNMQAVTFTHDNYHVAEGPLNIYIHVLTI